MQEARYLGHLEPGMDICDVDGNKFGSISRVYRQELATVGAGDATSAGAMPGEDRGGMPRDDMGGMARDSMGGMHRDDILEVKTGLFGLGKHLYIPFNAIQDVTSGCVFINQPKDRVGEVGWDVKPDYLEELT